MTVRSESDATGSPLKLFVTICNDARLLGHFLRHYSSRGVGHFYIALPPELRGEVEQRAQGHPATLCHGLDVADTILTGTSAVSEMRRRYQTPGEWIVIVDLDEFIECSDLRAVIAAADRAGANVVRGIMHDRFAADGLPRDFAADADLAEVFPVKARFIRNVMQGCDHKGVLVKGQLRPAPHALHHWFEDERAYGEVLEISHYKWISGALDRLRASLKRILDAGIAWSPEYQRVFDHFETHGRFAWEQFGGKLAADFVPEPPAARCADCGGAISEKEHQYSTTRFGKALCRTDQAHHASSSTQQLIDGYLGSHSVRKLHIGCSDHLLDGWLNADLAPASEAVLRLDATQPFPFGDGEFDYMFSEHMIEHVPYAQGARMLSECRRVLKPGGTIRISTPDLAFLIDLYRADKSPLQKDYIRWATEQFIPSAPACEDSFVINNFVRDWGHQFIYDEKTLSIALKNAGFTAITRCALNASAHEPLRQLENEARLPPGFLRLETLTLEATK